MRRSTNKHVSSKTRGKLIEANLLARRSWGGGLDAEKEKVELQVTGVNSEGERKRKELERRLWETRTSLDELEGAKHELLDESMRSMEHMLSELEKIRSHGDSMRESIERAKLQLEKADHLKEFCLRNNEMLRSETLEMQVVQEEEGEGVSQSISKYLPQGIGVCAECKPMKRSLEYCRIESGHTEQVREEGERERIVYLHQRYRDLLLARTSLFDRSKASFADGLLENFSLKLQKLEDFGMFQNQDWMDEISKKNNHVENGFYKKSSTLQPTFDRAYSYSGKGLLGNMKCVPRKRFFFTCGNLFVIQEFDRAEQQCFSQHDDLITSFSGHPREDPSTMASGQSGEGKVFIWDVDTLQTVAELSTTPSEEKKKHAVLWLDLPKGVRALSFNVQGDHLAVLGDDEQQTLLVFSCHVRHNRRPWSQCECIAKCSASQLKVVVCEYDRYSSRLVTGGVNHLAIWSVRAGALEQENVRSGHEVSEETHVSIGFVERDLMLTGTSSGLIFVWRGSRLHRIISNAHVGPVLSISCEGAKVTTGGQDEKVCLWNFDPLFRIANPGKLKDGEMLVEELFLPRISGFDSTREEEASDSLGANLSIGSVCSVSWNVNQLYCGTWNNHILVLDVARKTVEFYVAGHHGEAMSGLALDPQTETMATVGHDGVIIVTDTRKGRPKCALNLNASSFKAERRQRRKTKITCVDLHPTGSVAVATDDGVIFGFKLVEATQSALGLEQNLMSKLLLRRDRPTSIRFSPTATRLAVGMQSGRVCVYDFDDLVQQTIDPVVCLGLRQAVTNMDWNLEGSNIRCTDMYNNLRMYNAHNGNEIFNQKLKFRATVKRMRERGRSSMSPIAVSLTDSLPYLVTSVDKLFDVRGRRSDDLEYGNAQISVGDELLTVNGMEVQDMRAGELQLLLYGSVCTRECSTDCGHANITLELMRSVELERTTGKMAEEQEVKEQGRKKIEWNSLSCPLSWECSDLFLQEDEASALRSVTYLSDKETVIAGNVYGNIHVLTRNGGGIHVLRRDAGGTGGKVAEDSQQTIQCSVDFIVAHADKKIFVTASRTFELTVQWRLVAVEATARVEHADDELVAMRDEYREWYGASTKVVGQIAWQRREEDSLQRQLRWVQSSVPAPSKEARRVRSEYEVRIEHVLGQARATRRRAMAVLASGEMLYPLGIYCVVENLMEEETRQRLFVGHVNLVTTLTVHPNKRLVASGDAGPVAKVCVWDAEGAEWVDGVLTSEMLGLSGYFSSPISSLEFSRDGRLLMIAEEGGGGDVLIFDWELQPESPLARTSLPHGPPIVACHIPDTNLIVLCFHRGNKLLQVHDPSDEDASSSCSLSLTSTRVSDGHHAWALLQVASPGLEGNVEEAGLAYLTAGQTWMEAVASEWWASGTTGGELLLWHKEELVQSERAHEGCLLAVASNYEFRSGYFKTEGDGKDLQDSGDKGTGERVSWRRARQNKELDVKADRDLVVTVGADETMRVWKLSDSFVVGGRRFKIDELYARLKMLSQSIRSRLILISTIDLWIKTIQSLDVFELLSQSHVIGPHEWYPILEKNKKLAETYVDFFNFMLDVQRFCAAKYQTDTSELIQRVFSLENTIKTMRAEKLQDKVKILTHQNEISRLKKLLSEQNFAIQKSVALVEEFKVDHLKNNLSSSDTLQPQFLNFTSSSEVVLGYRDMSMFHLNLKDGCWRTIHQGFAADVTQIRASVDVNEMVTAGNSSHVNFWRVDNYKLRKHKLDRVVSSVDTCESFTVCGCEDGAMVFMLNDKQKLTYTIQLGKEKIHRVRINKAGDMLAAAVSREVLICNVQKLKGEGEGEDGNASLASSSSIVGRLSGHTSQVSELDWSVDGEWLRSVSLEAGELLFWDAFKCRRLSPFLSRDVEWLSASCSLGWHVIPGHEHTWLDEKLVSKHLRVTRGMQVTRQLVEEESRAVVGTVSRLTGEDVCLVQWHNKVAKSFWQMEKEAENEDKRKQLRLLDNTRENYILVTDSWKDQEEGIQLVGCGDRNGHVLIFDSSQHAFPRPILQVQVHSGPVSQLSFSMDGSRIFTYGEDSCLTAWRFQKRAAGVCLADFLLDCSTGSSIHFFKRLKELPAMLFPSDRVGGRERMKHVLKLVDQMRSGVRGDSDRSVGVIMSFDERMGIELFQQRKQPRVIEQIAEELLLLFDIPSRRVEFHVIDRKVCTTFQFNLLPRFSQSEPSTHQCLSLLLQEIINPFVLKKRQSSFKYLQHVILANKVETFRTSGNKQLQQQVEEQDSKSANLIARLRRFEQRFRIYHRRIFEGIQPTKVTQSRSGQQRVKFNETIMTRGELKLLFNLLDHGNRKVIRVDDLLKAVKNNPDLANILNVATESSQSMILKRIESKLPNSPKELMSREIDANDFISIFKEERSKTEEEQEVKRIEGDRWSIRNRIHQAPGTHLTSLLVSRPWREAIRRERSPSELWEHGIHSLTSLMADRNTNKDVEAGGGVKASLQSTTDEAFRRHMKQYAPVKTALEVFQVLDVNSRGFITFSSLCDALQAGDDAVKLGIFILDSFQAFTARLSRYLFGEEEISGSRPISLDHFLERFSATSRDKLSVVVPFRPPMKPSKISASLTLHLFQEIQGGLGRSVKFEDLMQYVKSNRTCSDALGLTDWLKQGDAAERVSLHIFGSSSGWKERELLLEDFLVAFAHVSKDKLGVSRPYKMPRWKQSLPKISLPTAMKVFDMCSDKPAHSISFGQLIESLERYPNMVEMMQLGEVMKEEDRAATIFQSMFGSKEMDFRKSISFQDFIRIFSSQDKHALGLSKGFKRKRRRARVTLLPVDMASKCFEELDERRRGFITHSELISKLYDKPHLAKALGLANKMSFMPRQRFSLFLYGIFNPGKSEVAEAQKYSSRHFVKTLSGTDLAGQSNALRNWRKLFRSQLDRPRWTQLVTRLLIFNLSLFSVKGIRRIRNAAVQAAELTVRFMEAIDSPRAVLHKGDGDKIAAVLCQVVYIANFNGPVHESQLDLAVSRVRRLLDSMRSKGLSAT